MHARHRFITLATLLWLATGPAAAAPLFGGDELQRNGGISRHLWTPDFTRTEFAGMRLSAGLALGLREPLHAPLGRRVAPSLSLDLGQRTQLSLLPAPGRGAMLVLQQGR
jgi:hypothetical protein